MLARVMFQNIGKFYFCTGQTLNLATILQLLFVGPI